MSEGYDLVELLGFEFSVVLHCLTVKRSRILRVFRSARPSHVPRCQPVGCPCRRVVLCPEDRAVMAVMAVMVPFWCWQAVFESCDVRYRVVLHFRRDVGSPRPPKLIVISSLHRFELEILQLSHDATSLVAHAIGCINILSYAVI